MREILFRGKRVDNGKWAKGYYRHHKSKVTGEEISQILVDDIGNIHDNPELLEGGEQNDR